MDDFLLENQENAAQAESFGATVPSAMESQMELNLTGSNDGCFFLK